jgi:polyhydroxyalkanoate synthesis regulator phasin
MFDAAKQLLYTGIGIASLTREKLTELSQEIARQADLSETQAREFGEELQKKGEEARRGFEKEVDRMVEQAMVRLGVARATQVEALLRRIETLEQQVQALQGQGE